MDPGQLEDLPEEEKKKMLKAIEKMQTRDSLRMYNTLVDTCYTNCVHKFLRKDLEDAEEKCIARCVEKYLKHSARTSLRFAELNAGAPQGSAVPQQPPAQ